MTTTEIFVDEDGALSTQNENGGRIEFKPTFTEDSSFDTVMYFHPVDPLDLTTAKLVNVNMNSLSNLVNKLNISQLRAEYRDYIDYLGGSYKFTNIFNLIKDFCDKYPKKCKDSMKFQLEIKLFKDLLPEALLKYIEHLDDETYIKFKSTRGNTLIFQKKSSKVDYSCDKDDSMCAIMFKSRKSPRKTKSQRSTKVESKRRSKRRSKKTSKKRSKKTSKKRSKTKQNRF